MDEGITSALKELEEAKERAKTELNQETYKEALNELLASVEKNKDLAIKNYHEQNERYARIDLSAEVLIKVRQNNRESLLRTLNLLKQSINRFRERFRP